MTKIPQCDRSHDDVENRKGYEDRAAWLPTSHDSIVLSTPSHPPTDKGDPDRIRETPTGQGAAVSAATTLRKQLCGLTKSVALLRKSGQEF